MSHERITGIYDVCPVCSHRQKTFSNECDDCGYPIGKDWSTVEVCRETDAIVRTVIPAQPKEAKA